MELPLVEYNPYAPKKDAIPHWDYEGGKKIQHDADLLILNQVEQKHKAECDNCPSAKLYDKAYPRMIELGVEIAELRKKLYDCIEQRRQSISQVESLQAKLGHEHLMAQAYSDNAEWAEADLERNKEDK